MHLCGGLPQALAHSFQAFLGTRVYHSLYPVVENSQNLPSKVPGRDKQHNGLCQLFHGLSFAPSIAHCSYGRILCNRNLLCIMISREGIELPSYNQGEFLMTCAKFQPEAWHLRAGHWPIKMSMITSHQEITQRQTFVSQMDTWCSHVRASLSWYSHDILVMFPQYFIPSTTKNLNPLKRH